MIERETFWTLLSDPNHWLFELMLMLIFDVIIGVIVWPWVKRAFLHHASDDNKIAALEKEVDDLRIHLGLPTKRKVVNSAEEIKAGRR